MTLVEILMPIFAGITAAIMYRKGFNDGVKHAKNRRESD